MKTKIWILAALLMLALGQVSAAEKITYYHLDALGSPIAATDENGQLAWKEAYKPYGERIRKEDGGSNSTWYTGKQEDEDNGLTYFGARWYDSGVGRFMGMDPVGVQAENVHSFNRFAYANNNPYRFVDPDGRSPKLLEWSGRAGWAAGEGINVAVYHAAGVSLSTMIVDIAWNVLRNEDGSDDGINNTGTVDDLLDGTEPDNDHKKSPKSDQRKYTEGGGFDTANDKFDNIARPKNIKDRGDGVRTGELDDGSIITVRPKSSPSISIKPPGKKKQIKIRY